MNRNFILIILFIFSCSPDYSEINFEKINLDNQFPKLLDVIGGSDEDEVKKVISTSDGGFIIIGNSKSTDGHFKMKKRSGNDIFALKFNSLLEIQWINFYGGSEDDVGSDIIESPDGGFYIIGYSKSNDGDLTTNMGQHDNLLLKIDSAGNLLWEKSYGFAGHDHAYNILATKDGGLFFNGFLDVTASNGQGRSFRHGIGEFWCHKTDNDGNIIWRNYFGGSNNDRSYDAVETSDGGYILIGTSESDDFDISNPRGSYDIWLVRLTKSGEMVWEKSYGGNGIDKGIVILNNIENSFTILGNTNSEMTGVESKGGNDYVIIKLDLDGNTINKIRHGGSDFDFAQDFIQTKDGSYFITGYSKNPQNSLATSLDKNSVFITQTQRNGIVEKTWSISGSNDDLGTSLCQLMDGSIILVGTTKSSDGDFQRIDTNSTDIFIAILKQYK
ncbi:MAG: hypothetical protein CMC81_01695 [Flavobacteriaceae bacterium]|nr:hypothetical protein [Flavobacteriaceae bacterium]